MQNDEDYLKHANDSKNSLYYLEVLAESSHDYRLIEKSFNNTGNMYSKTSNEMEVSIKNIYRVRSRLPKMIKHSSNILVFHGTPRRNVPGILTSGFKSSDYGQFGPGVYHSNFVTKCLHYSSCLGSNKDFFIFVNELPFNYLSEKSVEGPPETYCCKYLCSDDKQLEEYERDSEGSFINIAVDRIDDLPEFVASSNIVVPKYLVQAAGVKKMLVERLNNLVIYFITV